jgi:beta-lactamase regulating signal transducer with metallopeptidase domain
MDKVVPLKSSFALASLLGFLIVVIYRDRIGYDWSFALGFLFALMFVASMVSMSKAPIEEQLEMNPDLAGEKVKKPKKADKKKKKK